MSQHDLEIANQTFPATRTDLNNALQALGSLQSGGTAPATTYANMLWYDTANNILKLRNEDDDAWINVFEADQATDVIDLISRLKAPDGTVSLPSVTFASDTDTGIYRVGANQIGIATGGILRLTIDSDGDATFLSGTPAVRIKDINSTGSSQVGQIDFVDSADATKASIGYLSGSNTRLSIKNDASSGEVRVDINGTDRVIVDSAGAEVVGTLEVSGDYTTTDGDITTTNGTITADAFVGDGSGITGLPTFTVEGRADAFGNDTTISLSAGTILVLGEVYIGTSASLGARVSVQLKTAGGTVVDSFDLLGMNENNGTDGGSGMSGRVNFTVAVPATVTQIRFYRSSGSRTVDGTVNQFLKYGV